MLPEYVRAVLFDLDETLIDDDRGMRASVSSVAAELAQRYPELDQARLADTYTHESDRFWSQLGNVPTGGAAGKDGRSLRTTLWRSVLNQHGVTLTEAAELATDLYAEARRKTYTLFDDVLPALRMLRATRQLGILSNGAGDTQREKMSATGLDTYFDAVVISGEVGVGKPDPRAFALAAELLEPADHLAHVVDSLASDVEGARRSGVLPIWLNRGGHGEALAGTITIRRLTELA